MQDGRVRSVSLPGYTLMAVIFFLPFSPPGLTRTSPSGPQQSQAGLFSVSALDRGAQELMKIRAF